MALKGSLRDFSLPDVFQLITFSRKTGVLRISGSGTATGAVWFRDGEVFFAQSNWHHEPLGERLVTARKITPSALEKALTIRHAEPEGGRRLGRILVDEGYITEKVLEAFVQEQIQDTIFDLMRWESGEFDFELLPEAVDEDIGLTVSIENVIMEGSRRLDEWARIKKKVPSMDVVFKMATAPGEGTFEISLKPIEWSLLLLIDGTRSVAELARATGRTDFEVARVLYGLFSAGLLEFVIDEDAEPSEPRETPAAEPEPEPESEPEPEPEPKPEPEPAPEPEPVPEPELDYVVIEPTPEPEPEPDVPAFLSAPAQAFEPASITFADIADDLPEPSPPEPALLEAPPVEVEVARFEEAPERSLVPEQDEPDFSDLLDSLDGPTVSQHLEPELEPLTIEADETEPALEPWAADADSSEAPEPEGVDEPDTSGMLPAEERDADDGLAVDMTDEIGALTGARPRPRPQVNVGLNEGAPTGPKRDEAVDRILVLKIIEGLKKL